MHTCHRAACGGDADQPKISSQRVLEHFRFIGFDNELAIAFEAKPPVHSPQREGTAPLLA